jgi:hypothetical protein
MKAVVPLGRAADEAWRCGWGLNQAKYPSWYRHQPLASRESNLISRNFTFLACGFVPYAMAFARAASLQHPLMQLKKLK